MENRNFVTPGLKRRLQRLKEDCFALHLPVPPVSFIKLNVTEADGREWEHFEKTHSWVLNYYKLIGALFMNTSSTVAPYGDNSFTLKDLAGSDFITSYQAPALGTSLGTVTSVAIAFTNEPVMTDGIQIGSSASQADGHDYSALVAPIAVTNDFTIIGPSNVNELLSVYRQQEREWQRTLYKIFVNTSQNTYNIREVGLGVRTGPTGATTKKALMDRTVLSEPVVLGPLATIKVQYIIKMSLPANPA
jgi:hypothetical protein